MMIRLFAWMFVAAGLVLGAAPAQAQPDDLAPVAHLFKSLEYKYTGGPYAGEVFKYRLLKPRNMEPGKTYPLVLFLHGAGERGDDNVSQLKYLPQWMAESPYAEQFPCFLLAPQCRAGRKWVNVPWDSERSTPAGAATHQMRAALGMLMKTLRTEPIDRNRVYLTGLSMGGFGSWDLATRYPQLFAAVAPICGGGDEMMADRLTRTKIWAWHGGADSVVPVVRSRNMVQAINKAGGDAKYTKLPGVGHNAWTPAYTREDGVVPWMFKQRKP